jgi:hypothetical protein
MSESVMAAFRAHPKEAEVIGRLLAGYGELEFLMALCVAECVGSLSTASRLLFRSRSEEQRISIADAILVPYCDRLKILNEWDKIRRGLSWCKQTRNQFSHCHWLDDGPGGLFFTNIEKAAKTKIGEAKLVFFHVDVDLLNLHEAYFRWTGESLIYLKSEIAKLLGRPIGDSISPLKVIPQPVRHNPPENHPLQSKNNSRKTN